MIADDKKILTAKAVCNKIGRAKQTLMKYVKNGSFPKPHKYKQYNVWHLYEVEEWLEEKEKENENLITE